MLESISDMVDPGLFTFLHTHLDDIEAPRKVTRPEALEPGVRSALDEGLFVFSHGIQTADLAALAAGLDFDEKQQLGIPRNDVHLAPPRAAVISREDLAALRPKPVVSHLLPVVP